MMRAGMWSQSRSRHISLKSEAGAEVEVAFTFAMGTRPEPKIVRISGAFLEPEPSKNWTGSASLDGRVPNLATKFKSNNS